MPAPDSVLHLVDHFHAQLPALKSGLYNEAQVRQEFINPLFAALGWDMDNRQKLPLDLREVVHEDAIRVGGVLKAPDYSFRVGGARKFFVEAKQPSVKLDQAAGPAFQLRRYAWSASLPLSILTDFEEFAVYDCRYEPSQFDLPTVARVDYIRYTDYAAHWDSIAARFAHDAVAAGALDRYAEAVKAKKGALTVDKAFLREIERWRDLLARNLALRNPGLGHAALNYAVQMTIDRLIFLRMAEDRAIERYGHLKTATTTPNVYANLVLQFAQADARYNSGLFHFKPEPGREHEDRLTLGLTVDDEPLRDIIAHLYYPDSPYAFTVMPVELLGQVYEQFLGKVITLGPDHRAVVEEKPEVRKAGGVYYTPAYIVDYIVRHTLGPLLAGGPTTEDGGRETKKLSSSVVRPSSSVLPPSSVLRLPSPLRVLDPACGSGSFLLGAYDYLLDWYRDQYVADGPARHKTRLRPIAGGGWRLTLAERKRILLDHIYGVDLDPQAVEVTKLSLLLKVLEDETAETLDPQMKMFHDRALPDLSANIQCGNSLIGPDFLAGRPYDPDQAARVNPFDWQAAFPAVFAGDNPGFDAVIGNPPYIRMEGFKDLKQHLKTNYASHDERSDLYAYFMEAGHRRLNQQGRFGMIVSNKFLRANYGKPLREFLRKNVTIEQMVDFAGLPVFPGATVRTIVFISSQGADKQHDLLYSPPISPRTFLSVASGQLTVEKAIEDITYRISPTVLAQPVWSFGQSEDKELLAQIQAKNQPLVDYVERQIGMGIKSGLTEAFVIDEQTRKMIVEQNPKAAAIIKPFVNGRDVRRYLVESSNTYLIYTYHGLNVEDYPAIEQHLIPFKERLEKRATRQEWYELQQPQYRFSRYMDEPKIIFPDIAKAPRFALDDTGFYGSNTTYFIPRRDLYLLGLLNSRLGC